MRLADIMNTEVQTVSPETRAAEARTIMHLHGIHHLVVVKDRTVCGVVSAGDLGARLAAGRFVDDAAVADMMTSSPCKGTPTMTVRDAANLMRGHAIGCLPVLDRGRLVGIVTTSDLLALIGRGFERPVVRTKRWTLKHRGNRRAWKAPGGGRGVART